jgi:hypothetical protein
LNQIVYQTTYLPVGSTETGAYLAMITIPHPIIDGIHTLMPALLLK